MITLTKSEKINLGTKEITKRIREELKQFKDCKFSVSMERYSGGSSIAVALMESKIKVIKDFEEISDLALEWVIKDTHYTRKLIQNRQSDGYAQLNQYLLLGEYTQNVWNNGLFLTKEGHDLLRKVVDIVNQYNFDESDIQTDYFSVNFHFHLNIGKWDKPYKRTT